MNKKEIVSELTNELKNLLVDKCLMSCQGILVKELIYLDDGVSYKVEIILDKKINLFEMFELIKIIKKLIKKYNQLFISDADVVFESWKRRIKISIFIF